MTGVESTISILLALLLFTSFVKITTALSIVRYGIGLTGFEFGVVSLVVALAVSVVSAPPELRAAGISARVLLEPTAKIDSGKVVQAVLPYMKAHTDSEVAEALAGTEAARARADEPYQQGAFSELGEVGAVFVLSELKAAVSAAALVLVPFIVIDLIVAHLIALLGVQHLSTQLVSLPLKLMLFLAVDGWSLLIGKLVKL